MYLWLCGSCFCTKLSLMCRSSSTVAVFFFCRCVLLVIEVVIIHVVLDVAVVSYSSCNLFVILSFVILVVAVNLALNG